MWKNSSYISVTWRYESLGILAHKIPVQRDVHGSPRPQFLSLLEESIKLPLIALRALTANIREAIFSSSSKDQQSIRVVQNIVTVWTRRPWSRNRMRMHTHFKICQQERVHGP